MKEIVVRSIASRVRDVLQVRIQEHMRCAMPSCKFPHKVVKTDSIPFIVGEDVFLSQIKLHIPNEWQ